MWIYVIVVVVALALGFLLAPRPNANLSPGTVESPTAEEGRSIPVLFGSRLIRGPNLVWYGNQLVKPIPSDNVKGYLYSLDFHIVLCHAPIDYLMEILVADKSCKLLQNDGILFPPLSVINENGTYIIDGTDIFGGFDREGGVSGPFDYMDGNSSQELNTRLADAINSDKVPSFRGVVSIAAYGMYIGTTPYMKDWAFYVRRISMAWLPDKAAINKYPDAVLISDLAFPATIATVGSYAGITISTGFTVNDIIIVRKPPGLTYKAWSGWTSDGGAPGGLAWSNNFKVTTDIFQTKEYWPGLYATQDLAQAAVDNQVVYLTGSTSYTFFVPHIPVAENRGGLSIMIYRAASISQAVSADMNPAHIIRECLINAVWGMGYAEADIDDTSFTAAANTLFDEKLGMSLLWDTESTIEDFISTVCKHINASIYVNRRTGKFILKLIRFDYVFPFLRQFGVYNVTSVSDYQRVQFGELINAVTVQYWDSVTRNTATVTVQDIAAIAMQGSQISTTVKYDGLTNSNIASKIAQRDLKVLGTPLVSCTVYTNNNAIDLNIGDCFTLTWPDYQMLDMVMRVTGIGYGDGKSNRIRLTCVQDVFFMPTTAFIAPTPPLIPEIPLAIATIYRLPYELPYVEAVQQMGKATIDGLIASFSFLAFVGIAAAKPQTKAVDAQMWVDDGSLDVTFYEYKANVNFCEFAFTTAAMTKQSTTVTLATTPVVNATSWVQIDNELMEVVSIISGTLTVRRGLLDTVPEVHASGAYAFFWDDYGMRDTEQYATDSSLDIKLLTSTGFNILSLNDAPVDTIVMTGRMARPYPPGQFKINSAYYPTTIVCTVDIALSWVARNRLTQTAKPYVGFLSATATAEAGTTYTVRARDAAHPATLIYNETGLTTLTHTIPANSLTSVTDTILELFAVRSGLESYQIHSHAFATGAVGLLLDILSVSALGAYSCYRKLRLSYSGPAILVRRNDNVELAFGFVAGVFDSSALITWAAGQSCYVTTLYDQTGNGRDLTETNASKQPRIVNAGTLEVNASGHAAMKFDGSDDRLTLGNTFGLSGSPALTVAWAEESHGSLYSWFFGTNGAGTNFNAYQDPGATQVEIAHGASGRGFNFTPTTASHYFVAGKAASVTLANYTLEADGTALIQEALVGGSTTMSLSTAGFVLGAAPSGSYHSMHCSAFLVFNSVLAGADLTALRAELAAHA